MAHDSAVPSSIPFRVLDSVSGALKGAVAVLVVIGVLAAVLAGGTPDRLWQSLLFNWLFWSSMALGMVMFAVALRLTNADWAWSIRRFALGGGAFLPISFVLLPIVLFGGYEHYFHHWLHAEGDPVIEAKSAWLSWPGLGIRDILLVAILYGVALAFVYHTVRPDVYGVKNTRNGALYQRLTTDRVAPIDAIRNALAAFRAEKISEFHGESPLICTCFGVTEEIIEAHAATAVSVEEIGDATNAGTGCGSCRMLIQEILDAHAES